jgi:hypothetical protein|tara:strand:- start:65 stop:229 length:165 start_codon:yes stop_codon:yes gene_type:complete
MYLGIPKVGQILDGVEDGALVRKGRIEIVLVALLVHRDALEDDELRVWCGGRSG